MGVVYHARDPRLQRDVALKVILGAQRVGSDEVARFIREARAVARLGHPGIVRVHEVGEDGGRPFIAMDFVEGEPLSSLVQREGAGLDRRRLAGILAAAADALQHAHDRGIIHRDLKPQNIMIDRDGAPRVLDFGLARDESAQGELTRTGEILGTFQYMAPEQALGERDMGPAVDVYGLGATLYASLTGRHPFTGPTPASILTHILLEPPRPPRLWVSDIPEDLERIVLHCLAKAPGDRYGSAAELAADLRRFVEGAPISLRPTGVGERAGGWVRRNPAVAALSAALAVVFVAAGLLGWALLQQRGGRRDPADDPAAVAVEAPGGRGGEVVATVLARCRRGELGAPNASEDALFELVAAADASAVEALAGALDAVSAELLRVRTEALLAVVEPSEGERRRGGTRIEGLEPFIERAIPFAHPPAQPEVIRRALRRVEGRAGAGEGRTAIEVLAAAQARSLGGARLLEARLCAEALGRIGTHAPEAALSALARYLEAECDGRRATRAAIALCQLGTAEATEIVLATRGVFGGDGPYWNRVGRHLAGAGVSAEAAGDDLAAMVSRAHALVDAEQIADALALYGRVLDRAPTHYDALCGRSRALAVAGRPHDAIADLDRAIAAFPDRAAAWSNRGLMRIQIDDHAGALPDLDRGIALDPSDYRALVNRATGRSRTGDPAGARADLDRAVAIEPDYAHAWADRAEIRAASGDLPGALADASRAIELDPSIASSWVTRGMARAMGGDVAGGLDDLDTVIAAHPRHAAAWHNRALIRASRGEHRAALADWDRTIELERPERAITHLRRASSRRALGDGPGALQDVDRAVELEPTDPGTRLERGLLRRALGDADGCREDLEEALRLGLPEPKASQVRAALASGQ